MRVDERVRVAVCVILLVQVPALADQVFWGCQYGEAQLLRSGQVTCRQEVRDCNTFVLSCSRGPVRLFRVNDFADYIAASEDGRYVVGLSNRGSMNAFWIRNLQGTVIKRKTHFLGPHYEKGLHYCARSVSNVRKWFDSKDPNVRFQFVRGKLTQVLVRGCDGNDIRLLRR